MNLLTTIAESGKNVFAATYATPSYTATKDSFVRLRFVLTGWFAGASANFITVRITIGGTEYTSESRAANALSTLFFNTSTANTILGSHPFALRSGESIRFGLRSTNAADTSVAYSVEIWDDDTATVSGGYTTARAAKLDNLDAAISTRATPADVSVTASVAVSATTAATVSTGNLALSTSYTLRQSVTSTVTDNLSTATKLWLSIKASASDTDAQSLVFVEKTAGLTVVNGASYATTGNGSLTVSGSSGAWSVAIHVDEAATALLVGRNGRYIAAVKALVGTDTVSVWEGGCVIADGIVRAYA